MDLQLNGRIALVTGASAGIGEAVALSLASEGVLLALAARRMDKLESVAREAVRRGAQRAEAFYFDQNDITSVRSLISNVSEKLGGLDILVANGGGPSASTFLDTPLEQWDRGYRDLLRSMIELVNLSLPHMRASQWGRIVALTSMSVKQPIPGLVLSSAFRTALVAALKTVAGEVASDGVTINCIATGRILTQRLLELYGNDERQVTEAARRDIPIGRAGTVEEFAPVVTFLCGEPSRFVTGQTIAVDGGEIKSLY